MMHGVMHAQTCGRMKVDDDDARVQMSGCVNSVGWVTDMGGGLSGRGKCVEMGNPDVFSARCNRMLELAGHRLTRCFVCSTD